MSKKQKKKKVKQAEERDRKELRSLSAPQLRERAALEMEKGRYRDALELLRYCAKTHGSDPETDRMIFRACLHRSAGLRGKGMIPEADAMAASTDAYIRNLAAGACHASATAEPAAPMAPAEETLADVLLYCSLRPGPPPFQVIGSLLSHFPEPPPTLTDCLVNRLLEHREWEHLAFLPPDWPGHRDAETVRAALPLMDEGDWENALPLLRPLPRKSPLAPLRLFCRGMAAFYRKEDEDAVKALSMTPESFPLYPLARKLCRVLSLPQESEARAAAASRLPVYRRTGIPGLPPDLDTLMDDIDDGRKKAAVHRIRGILRELPPEDAKRFRSLIREILLLILVREGQMDREMMDHLEALFPDRVLDDMVETLNIRHSRCPPLLVAQYIQTTLPNLFPDGIDLRYATAAVLLHAVRTIETPENMRELMFGRPGSVPDFRSLGKPLGFKGFPEPDIALVWMCAEASRLTPEDREPYELAASLPRPRREVSQAVEEVLERMLGQFPEDPFPCLELATLHYERHAFRKAEAVLQEARKRAPHDQTVMDRYTISLLYSAHKNMKRGKYHLAAPDLDRAAELESDRIAPHVREKRILLRLMAPAAAAVSFAKDGQLSLFSSQREESFRPWIEGLLSPFSLVQRIRIIAFLLLDMEDIAAKQFREVTAELTDLLKSMAQEAQTLSSRDMAALFASLGKEYVGVYPKSSPIGPLRAHAKRLLAAVDTSDILTLYERFIEQGEWKILKADISKRLKETKGTPRLTLRFYLEAIRHAAGDTRSLVELDKVVGDAENDRMEHALRQASHRLAPLFTGALGRALADFRFIDRDFPNFSFFEDEDDDDFEDDDLDEDDIDTFLDSSPEMLISMIMEEAMSNPAFLGRLLMEGMESHGLVGKPDQELVAMRAKLDRKFPALANLLKAASNLPAAKKRKLPREALILMGEN